MDLVDPLAQAAAPVPTSTFDLETIDESERYAFWRESIACIFDIEAGDGVLDGGAISSRIWAAMHGSVMLADTTTFSQRWSRHSGLIARDGMDHYMVQVYEAGSMGYQGNAEILKSGEIIVFDLAQESESVTTAMRNLSLIIPRNQLAPLLERPNDQHLRRLEPSSGRNRLLRDHIRNLFALSPEMSMRDAISVNQATLSLIAACLNDLPPRSPEQMLGFRFARLTAVRNFIEQNLANPALGVEMISNTCGISRSALYGLFDRFGGVASYIRQNRLNRAMLLLQNPGKNHMTIAQIQAECGYANESAFARAVKATYGASPRELRQADFGAATLDLSDEALDRRYENWIQTLTI